MRIPTNEEIVAAQEAYKLNREEMQKDNFVISSVGWQPSKLIADKDPPPRLEQIEHLYSFHFKEGNRIVVHGAVDCTSDARKLNAAMSMCSDELLAILFDVVRMFTAHSDTIPIRSILLSGCDGYEEEWLYSPDTISRHSVNEWASLALLKLNDAMRYIVGNKAWYRIVENLMQSRDALRFANLLRIHEGATTASEEIQHQTLIYKQIEAGRHKKGKFGKLKRTMQIIGNFDKLTDLLKNETQLGDFNEADPPPPCRLREIEDGRLNYLMDGKDKSVTLERVKSTFRELNVMPQ